MAIAKIVIIFIFTKLTNALVIKDNKDNFHMISDNLESDISEKPESEPDNVFNGVYTDCFIQLSFTCLQNKTLIYLKELNRLNEVSVIGDYVKFVKLNSSGNIDEEESSVAPNADELSYMIDKAVDNFFDNHLIRFRAMGKEVLVPNRVEEFVGRKRRKGGGGGGGHGGGGGDGGKKKMMMMVMMCMKMKLMMMLPAMMGMMGMMSFKGMMFSMMSFMISKMMLLMKILEKKGAGGGGGVGGGDGGWAAGGGGGGAWMPAGGQDYGGGGYDANGQWQSRSIIEKKEFKTDQPIITYVKPVQYKDKDLNDKPKSRKRRGIIDVLQNAYLYWASKVLGVGYKKHQNHSKYKVVNGVKYVYHPVRSVTRAKTPKDLKPNVIKNNDDDLKPIVVDDFNKGEIIEVPVENRMMKKQMQKMKDMSETVDENPWE